MHNSMRLLLVSDNEHHLSLAQHALRPHALHWQVTTVTSAAAARAALASQPFDVVVAEADMPVGAGGTLLNHVRLLYPRTQRVPLQGASDLMVRITNALAREPAAKPMHASSLHEAFERLVHVR
jgi:DNA-binding NtrC family response regulator